MRVRRRRLVWLTGLVLLAGGAGGAAAWQHHVSRPEYRLRRGQEALRRHDWAAAVEQADLLAAADPDRAHLLRGQVYLHRGELARAIREYNAIRHDRPEVLAEASLVFGLGLLSVGRLVEAEPLLRYVLDVRPDDADAHRGLAKIHYERGSLTRAVRHLEAWAKLAPADGEPHRWMGLAYDGLGATPPAVEQYRLALTKQLSPRLREEVAVELAELLLKQKAYAEALACLDGRPSAATPDAPAVAELRAECLYGLGRGAEAARALANQPESPRSLRARAQGHLDAGEAAVAAALLEKALRLDAHDHTSRYRLAQAYEALGRRAEAAEQRRLLDRTAELMKRLTELSRAADDRPADAAVRRRLAEVCTQLNKPDLARMWLRAAASCPPGRAPGHAGL
jgi:tetratricopeptide (TPR) repeat protein